MSFTISQDFTGTGPQCLYTFKTLLKSVGWTVPSSSDATTYNSSGDQIASGSSGATGFANNSAWFILRCPSLDGYSREFCIQRGTNNTSYRIKYSLAGFSGGSPGATRTPSATDEQILIGGGTDASPTFTTYFATDSTYRANMMAGDYTDGYSAYLTTFTTGGTSAKYQLLFDRLVENSYAPEDIDPFVIMCRSTTATSTNLVTASSNSPRAWFRKGMTNEGFLDIGMLQLSITSGSALRIYNGILSNNPWNLKDDCIPIIYGRGAGAFTSYGIKGISKNLYMVTTSRSVADTLSINSTRDKILLDFLVLPWNGSSPTI